MIYVLSDCDLDDAIKYIHTKDVGNWTAINDETKYDTFIIKTSDTEVTVHNKVQFVVDPSYGFFMNMNGLHYVWDDFWDKMKEVYDLDLENQLILSSEEMLKS